MKKKDKNSSKLLTKSWEIIGLTLQSLFILKNEVVKTFWSFILMVKVMNMNISIKCWKTIWAPNIDGEIYINEMIEQIKFGQIYTVKAVTELIGDKLLGNYNQIVMNLNFSNQRIKKT